jgi:hypothetical protein
MWSLPLLMIDGEKTICQSTGCKMDYYIRSVIQVIVKNVLIKFGEDENTPQPEKYTWVCSDRFLTMGGFSMKQALIPYLGGIKMSGDRTAGLQITILLIIRFCF